MMTESFHPPSRLSELNVNTDKNWGGFNITNLGKVSVGDIELSNEWRIAEHPDHGVILLSPKGTGFKLAKEEI